MGTREMEELNNIRKQEALEEEMRKKNSKDKSEKRFNYVGLAEKHEYVMNNKLFSKGTNK